MTIFKNKIFLYVLAAVVGLLAGQLIYRVQLTYTAKNTKVDNIQYKVSQGKIEHSAISNIEKNGDSFTVTTTIGSSKKKLTFKDSPKALTTTDNRGLCGVSYIRDNEKPYMTFLQAYVGDANKGEDTLFNVHLYVPEKYKK